MMQLDRFTLHVAVVVLLSATGCAGWTDFTQHLAYKHQAHKAWQTTLANAYNGPCIHDYKDGWKTGYFDVARGESGCVPAVPPEKYWHCKYQQPEGQLCVCTWFNGYRDGVQAARALGAWYCRTIPASPTAVLPDRMACLDSPTYYSTWGDSTTAHPLPPVMEGREGLTPTEPDAAEPPSIESEVPQEEVVPLPDMNVPDSGGSPEAKGADALKVPAGAGLDAIVRHGVTESAQPAATPAPIAGPPLATKLPINDATRPSHPIAPSIPNGASDSLTLNDGIGEALVALPPVEESPLESRRAEPPVADLGPSEPVVAANPAAQRLMEWIPAAPPDEVQREPAPTIVAEAMPYADRAPQDAVTLPLAAPTNPAEEGLWAAADHGSPIPLPPPVLERLSEVHEPLPQDAAPAPYSSKSAVVRVVSMFNTSFPTPVAWPLPTTAPPAGTQLEIVDAAATGPRLATDQNVPCDVCIAPDAEHVKRTAEPRAESTPARVARVPEGQSELHIR